MSFVAQIRQRGLFKKQFPFEILTRGLSYGVYDESCRLMPGKLSDGDFVVYRQDAVGRGIVCNISQNGVVELILNVPASDADIRDFFGIARRVCDNWNCVINFEGEKLKPDEFTAKQDEYLALNERIIKNFCQKVLDDEYDILTINGAKWGLNVGKEEAERFLNNPKDYYVWLHEKQTTDAFYTAPLFRDDAGEVVGILAVPRETDETAIIALEPSVPLGMIDADTGKPLKCSKYRAVLYSDSLDEAVNQLDYAEFINRLPKEKYTRYDANHILLTPLSPEEMDRVFGIE